MSTDDDKISKPFDIAVTSFNTIIAPFDIAVAPFDSFEESSTQWLPFRRYATAIIGFHYVPQRLLYFTVLFIFTYIKNEYFSVLTTNPKLLFALVSFIRAGATTLFLSIIPNLWLSLPGPECRKSRHQGLFRSHERDVSQATEVGRIVQRSRTRDNL